MDGLLIVKMKLMIVTQRVRVEVARVPWQRWDFLTQTALTLEHLLGTPFALDISRDNGNQTTKGVHMKFKTLIAAALVFSGLNAFAEQQVPQAKEVQIGITGVYVPGGFDSASDVFVVVNGIFQNSCYSWKRADVDHKDTYVHEVKSIASVSQGMCLMVLVPFQKEVRLGRFAEGKHTLRFENGDGTYFERSLVVE